MERNKQDLKWGRYARKSSEQDDKQAASIESQNRELEELAPREHILVIPEYCLEESHSAKAAGQRPGFNKLLSLIEMGKVNALLVWSANRISRNAIDAAQIIDLMDRGKLFEVRTPTQVYYNTPNDKFLLQLFCSQGKLENDNKGVDVVRGLKNKAIGGVRPGPAPL